MAELSIPAHQDCIAFTDFHISNKCRLSFKFSIAHDNLTTEATVLYLSDITIEW
jgi:hypothetical protein